MTIMGHLHMTIAHTTNTNANTNVNASPNQEYDRMYNFVGKEGTSELEKAS